MAKCDLRQTGLYRKLVCIKTESKPPSKLEWHKQYDNIDGTGEMLMGLGVLAFALLGCLQSNLPKDTIWRFNAFGALVFMYLVLGAVLGPAYWLRHIIKKRITFPRTGYVASQLSWKAMWSAKPAGVPATPGVPSRKHLWQVILSLCLVSAIVGAGFATLLVLQRGYEILAAAGYVFYLSFWAALYLILVWRIGGRYPWKWGLAVIMAAGLAAIGIFGSGNILEDARPIMLLVGAVLLVSGLGTLISYVRHHPLPVEEAR